MGAAGAGAAGTGAGARRAVKLSLRSSAILLVTLVNLGVFGLVLALFTPYYARQQEERERTVADLLVERLQNLIDAQDRQAAGILGWPYWSKYRDALVVKLPERSPGVAAAVRAARAPSSAAAETTARVEDSGAARAAAEAGDPYGPWPFTEPPLRALFPSASEAGAGEDAARGAGEEGEPERASTPDSGEEAAPAEGLESLEGQPEGGPDPDPDADVDAGAVEDAALAARPARTSFDYSVLWRTGLMLNPVGSGHRPPGFDLEGVLRAIDEAVARQEAVPLHGGHAVPVFDPSGRPWGGCWFLPRPPATVWDLVRELAPWFAALTVVLSGATFVILRRLVLQPVEELARGARRVAAGDLSVRLAEPARGDEVSELIRGFNQMTGQVRGFNDRLAHEVEVATEKARSAEKAAMTQRRLAATGELAAGIAHEINNPLGGMLNALEKLERGDLPPRKREEYLGLLRDGLGRIRETVGQVLRLAPRATRAEPVALWRPLADALGLVHHRVQRQGVRVVLERAGRALPYEGPRSWALFEDLPPVLGVANELGQAALNVLVNSLDALEPSGGELRIGIEREEGGLHLWLADDGPGLDGDSLARAADLFFTTKQTGKGTGLGLAIVHNVVAGHGGRVLLSSAPGAGFRVDVHLPEWRPPQGRAGGDARGGAA